MYWIKVNISQGSCCQKQTVEIQIKIKKKNIKNSIKDKTSAKCLSFCLLICLTLKLGLYFLRPLADTDFHAERRRCTAAASVFQRKLRGA